MANELFELARRRRSCRKYTGERISDEVVDEILKIALLGRGAVTLSNSSSSAIRT